jgi:hypothetical protein
MRYESRPPGHNHMPGGWPHASCLMPHTSYLVPRTSPPQLFAGRAFAIQTSMSKQNPNQDYYKIGGRSQTDGPDKLHANANDDKQQLGEAQPQKDANHPAIRRAKRK